MSDCDDMLILIKFINQTLSENKESGITLNTVSSLWIILFALIIVQKLFKYVIKPINNRARATTTNSNQSESVNRDTSTECIII